MPFFELRTPRDMLEKTRREHQRLTDGFDIDNIFNFFITAYHISDYIQKNNAIAQIALDIFLQDQDIKDCHDLCDKGKHFSLTKRPDPKTHIWSGCIGGAPIGVLPVGGGDKWVLFTGSREVDVALLAQRVLTKWEAFFEIHGL